MSTLEQAVCIAATAHMGQKDKGGASYILHPLRLMMKMSTEEEQIVAVLHDVVEDSQWTIAALRSEGFGDAVLDAIECLTRRPSEEYESFIVRVSQNAMARRVKLADLEDNSDLSRLSDPSDDDHRRTEKYRRAIAVLSFTAQKE